MKLFLFLGSFCLLKSYLNSTQNLYEFDPEYCEVTNINESLVRFDVKKCFKLSRKELYLNISFVLKNHVLSDQMSQVGHSQRDCKSVSKLHPSLIMITGYLLRSNEYRKGPIEFMLGVCSAMTSKDFDIPHMFANSNMRCPFIKGRHYHAYMLSPNATNMPPFIPAGRWLLQLDAMYNNQYIIFSVKWYAGVEYPIRIFEG